MPGVVPNAKRYSARSTNSLSYNEPEVVGPGLRNLRKMMRERHMLDKVADRLPLMSERFADAVSKFGLPS